MDITKLHILTTSLRDATNTLQKIKREISDHQGKLASGIEEVVWATSLQGFNINTFVDAVKWVVGHYEDSDKYDMENSWFTIGNRYDLQGDHQVLQLKAYKLHTEQESKNIREVLLDTRGTLVTMCADYEKQIKEITNV